MKPTDDPVVVTQRFVCSVERLWAAITQLERMQAWYFPQLNAFEAVQGFATSFVVEFNDKTFPHVWKIVEVVDRKKLVCDWIKKVERMQSLIQADRRWCQATF